MGVATAERSGELGSVPSTTRGHPTAIAVGGDGAGDTLAIRCGAGVVLRSLSDPLRSAEVVYQHAAAAVTAVAVHPKGSWVASGDENGVLKLWPLRKAEGVSKENERRPKIDAKVLAGPISVIRFNGDGSRMAYATNGEVTPFIKESAWDSTTSRASFDGHSKGIISLDYSKSRPFKIVSGGEDMNINLYHGPPFKLKVSKSRVHNNFVNCVRMNNEGELTASACQDKSVKIFAGEEMDIKHTFDTHEKGAYGVAWSPNESTIVASCSADKTIKIWDVSQGQCKDTIIAASSEDDDISGMQVGIEWVNDKIISVGLSGDIKYWDPRAANDKPVVSIGGHNKYITSIALSRPNELLSTSYDGVVRRWSLEDNGSKRIHDVASHVREKQVFPPVAMKVAEHNVYSVGLDDMLVGGPVDGGSFLRVPLKGKPIDFDVTSDGSTKIVVTGKTILLLGNEEPVDEISPSSQPSSCAISGDGSRAAVGFVDGKIQVYNIDEKKLKHEGDLVRHRAGVSCLAFAPDHQRLASGDSVKEVVIWDTVSKEPLVTRLVYHSAKVLSLAWSPSGDLLASGSLDKSIIIWPSEGPGSKRHTISDAHHGGVTCLLWENEDSLLSAGYDCFIRKWSVSRS